MAASVKVIGSAFFFDSEMVVVVPSDMKLLCQVLPDIVAGGAGDEAANR